MSFCCPPERLPAGMMADVPQPGHPDELAGPLPQSRDALARHPSEAEGREQAWKCEHLTGDDQIFLHVERLEHDRLLKRAQHPALAGDAVEGPARDVLPVQSDLARVGLAEAGAAVEEGRLAGAVRSDEPADLAAIECACSHR